MNGLKGKNALIAGVTSGIGQAIPYPLGTPTLREGLRPMGNGIASLHAVRLANSTEII
ncbi:hypothetical protein H6F98_08865 [Microcoleus sp. FACHB-SPT15]|uniref:hypothetical protein n=1 Tax=Microcoleus sp. FACHB-SPT15 TaxID=2692830 RepID=UPI00177E79CB|nr:hypothetical protein [Microcoleus sp. FACHB-SPT15]MBD1805557.1 hypothetical protein [Microcoleus sp. FACHB-SPT15]